MAEPIGIKAKAAFVKDRGLYGAGPAITYPDTPGASQLAATHQIPYSSETVSEAIERQTDPALVGFGAVLPDDITGRFPAGSMEGRMRYRGWERLLAIALGFESGLTPATPGGSPETIVAGAYRHILEQDQDLQDEGWAPGELSGGSANDRKVRRGPFGLSKQVTDWVWSNIMVDKWTISGTPQGVDISFDLVGYGLVRGSYNSGSWTLPAGTAASALFQHLVIMLGTRVGGVGAMTAVGVSSFELSGSNGLKADDQTTDSDQRIEIPVRGAHRETRLKLELPRYRQDTEFIFADLDQEMISSLKFTGPIVTGATPYELNAFMSSMRFDPITSNVDGPGPLPLTMEFVAHRPITTNEFQATDCPNITLLQDSEIFFELVNDDSFNYLLEV